MFAVHFRVIPIIPDMMPMYGSLTIYVNVSTTDKSSTLDLYLVLQFFKSVYFKRL